MSQLDHQNQHEIINNRLNQAFPSRDADLRANRAGRLTPNQEERLKAEEKNSACFIWATVLLSAFLMFLIWLPQHPAQSGLDFRVIISVLFIAIILFNLFIKKGFTQDIQNNRVIKAQGVIEKRILHGKVMNRYIDLDQISFEVSHEIYEAFVDGERYILYYTPRSKTLVSAHHVPQSS